MLFVGMWDRIVQRNTALPKIAPELSARAAAAIKTEGRHAVGGAAGLHLRVSAGHRGWVLRIMVGDKRRDLGLGSFPEIGLAEAREKARQMHKLVREGVDPLSTKRAQRSALVARRAAEKNFDWCVGEFLQSKADEWKNAKHRQQWENTLKAYASPHLGHLLVQDIDLHHVLLCLEPIWKTKNETASRLRGRIESVLDWATVRKYRTGENPARWKGHLDKVLPAPMKIQKVQHHRAVPIDQMAGFMATLRGRDGIAARALEFTILTAGRSGEVRGATWPEIDLSAGIWTIPGERMKGGRQHRVPLSPAAVDLLKLKLVDEIVPEPRGGAHTNHELAATLLDTALGRALANTSRMTSEARLQARYDKWRTMGNVGLAES